MSIQLFCEFSGATRVCEFSGATRDHEHGCYNSLLPSAEVVHIHRESWSLYARVNYSHITAKVSGQGTLWSYFIGFSNKLGPLGFLGRQM